MNNNSTDNNGFGSCGMDAAEAATAAAGVCTGSGPRGAAAAAAAAGNRSAGTGSRPQRGMRQQQQQQAGSGSDLLQVSAAWSVFEQQLSALHNQRRQLLVLATTHLPVEQLPQEVQQLFGWTAATGKQQQQQGQQHFGSASQLQLPAGRDAAGWGGVRRAEHLQLSSSRTIQLCERVWPRDSGSSTPDAAAAKAALKEALDRAIHLAAGLLLADSSSTGSSGSEGVCVAEQLQPCDLPDTSRTSQDQQGTHSSSSREHPASGLGESGVQQQQPSAGVDALISAAMQQQQAKRQQLLQRRPPARVPTQQMVAVAQLRLPLQQMNDAQRAEAHTLLNQVGAHRRPLGTAQPCFAYIVPLPHCSIGLARPACHPLHLYWLRHAHTATYQHLLSASIQGILCGPRVDALCFQGSCTVLRSRVVPYVLCYAVLLRGTGAGSSPAYCPGCAA